ncbi:MAG: class I SAM-dependent methyltransferase [Antarcticimicrobium sp.]|uniref:class I SAM-dependent methyltransferase n=1 Tax=Antarcticimicrobium sp. TaxID=2824147 RepID=UPI00261FAC38|nr:class I SAM-dependent methyltransferase [Antarcticimicrobium sp.]MDF1715522.1 class I SAM-dependent methyltransferase [Antarcticimicrobium sp.]
MRRLRFEEGADVAQDIRDKYAFDGDLLALFSENKGEVVHKWHHYIPIYDRYFSQFRGGKVRFLEIGVNKGGSLQMWRSYFGQDATVFGIDINPDCAKFDGEAGQVRIGSQADPEFLNKVVDEMGGVDVVLDDGSHKMEHVRASLEILFPRLAENGIYMIEDLHTAYFPKYGGGYRSGDNFFRYVRELIDDMHRWYHRKGLRHPDLGGQVSGLHIHDSITVIEKQPVHRPTHSRVG